MPDDQSIDRGELLALTADIVAAHVGNNAVSGMDLGGLIQSVFDTLRGLATDEPTVVAELSPAVPIRRSVTDDHIVCLEDGKKFKSLKRHLMTHHQLTPQQYRDKWSLPVDYPMVAPNYSATRSSLAKSSGLGRKAAPPTKRGRKAEEALAARPSAWELGRLRRVFGGVAVAVAALVLA